METNMPIRIFSGRSTLHLAERIAKSLGIPVSKSTIHLFSDGEFQPSIDETVRGAYVFIIQSTTPPADNLFELLLLIDAAKRASAHTIAAVIPYYGIARQDRKDKPRVSIGAKLVANLLIAAGVSRVMTMDLHADQIQGFFDVPVDHLYSSAIFVPYIRSLNLDNLVVASPDVGGTKRAGAYTKFLEAPLVICHKTRSRPNQVDEITVIGDVHDKNIILVDDIIDTGGTIVKSAARLLEAGAKSVRAFITHPVLSGTAVEKIENSQLTELVVTDTIPFNKNCSKIKVLSVCDVFANAMEKVYHSKSISTLFILDKDKPKVEFREIKN